MSAGVVRRCDTAMPSPKGGCERNHEFIRCILPKGTSFNNLTQEKVDLMMNHINSYGREKYNYKSPATLFYTRYGEEKAKKLGILMISPHDIYLNPELSK